MLPPDSSQADTKAPIATITGLRNREHFAKHKGPRELKGAVTDDGSLSAVQIRLKRKTHRHCFVFDGKDERFEKRHCSHDAPWFGVGTTADWSYLLPHKLRSGLYQLQVRATDAAGNQSWVRSLRFRVA